jgi:hypothetical protein
VVRLAGQALQERASESWLEGKVQASGPSAAASDEAAAASKHEADDRAAVATENLARFGEVCKKADQTSKRANEARANASSGQPSPGDAKQSE